ncbi:MAG: L-lactate permease [Proteobacteria bacterium]|nr:L-lactate permease [Pseudomonadota bacterium]
MDAAFALLPLILVVALMTFARWPAAAAGLVGAVTALLVAILHFDYRGSGEMGLLSSTAGLVAEATFLSMTILWIVFPALCLHELQVKSGATATLRQGLSGITRDPQLGALLIAFFFALFFEGAAGFGTPVALAAPLLVGLGFTPVRALTLTLIGHSIGVSFGAVGTPVLVQTGPWSELELSGTIALMHAALGWTMAVWVYRLAAHEPFVEPGSWRQLRWPLLAAASFLLPYAVIALWVGPELPTLGGALLGGCVFSLCVRARSTGQLTSIPASAWIRAALPYLLLLVLILVTRLLPPVREALMSVQLSWTIAEYFRGSIQPLYHPGTLLMLCFLASGLMRRTSRGDMQSAASSAMRRLPLVLLSLIAMLVLARVMLHAGMIHTLALAVAHGAGQAWPLLAPATGALGTFITGSATASNILLTELQVATANTLELPVVTMVAAQAFGAAVGNIICPHNIIAGSATVGLVGREGEVMKKTLTACAVYAALGGVLVFLLVR